MSYKIKRSQGQNHRIRSEELRCKSLEEKLEFCQGVGNQEFFDGQVSFEIPIEHPSGDAI